MPRRTWTEAQKSVQQEKMRAWRARRTVHTIDSAVTAAVNTRLANVRALSFVRMYLHGVDSGQWGLSAYGRLSTVEMMRLLESVLDCDEQS